MEPMQGTAGNVIPPDDFVHAVREIADEFDALLIADEILTGFGRTGTMWASDQFGLKIQFVGETLPGDQLAIIEGDPTEDRFLAAYGRAGRLVAALGVRRPARVMALQGQIGSGAPFPPEG